MVVDVKVPVLSESVSEATLLSWHKKPGDPVERDENLIDIETDKVVLELPAPASGVLASIKKADGSTVVSDEVIATIDTDAKASAPAPKKAPQTPWAQPAPAQTAPQMAAEEGVAVMPAARKLLAENNVNPEQLVGTGRGGRITKEDVVARLERSRPAEAPVKPAAAPMPSPVKLEAILGERPEQRVPMSRLRKRVAERLVESQSSAAILTTFNEVNMQPVIELRNRYRERFEKEHGVKLGFMSFFVKAAVAALKKFPIVNASVDGDDIVYHGYFDIGIAVATPRGLVVPIIRDADQLGMAEIEKKITDFGVRAREGRLTIEELTGGTFSISNGGVFGSMLSTPIINPPQSAILGVHATKDRPVAENGEIVIRPMNYLALSYDHRIIDGREAVLSLVAIKEALEDPARILLDL
jgi:2-oxoglutarate dehydrogenase E2 component (dihydrolipoamide succinyltransferase)